MGQLNYNAEYEKIFFLYALSNPKILKSFYPGFFDNAELDGMANISKKFYEKFSEAPSKQQLSALIQRTELKDKVTTSIIDMVFETNVKDYDPEWLSRIVTSWVTWRNFDRQLIKTVEYVKLQDVTPENVETIVNNAINLISTKGVTHLDTDIGLDFFNADNHRQRTSQKISSGREWVDRIAGGYDLKTFILYTGATGSGKSVFLCNDAATFVRMGYNVCYITLELADHKVLKRIGSNLLNIKMSEYDSVSTNTEFMKRKIDGVSRGLLPPGKLFVKEFPTSQASVLDVDAYVKQLEETTGTKIQVLIIDYLNILANYRNANSENTYMKVKQIAEDLRGMAVKNNYLILSATQVNRCLEENTILETENDTVKIKDIKVGDLIKSNNKLVKVKYKTELTKQKGYKIKLKSGKEIICGGNHRFPIKDLDGNLLIASELKSGDVLLSATDTNR
jgi:replicative DNA helicase